MARDSKPTKIRSTKQLRVDGERFRAADGSEHRHDVESMTKDSPPPKTESIVKMQSRWREFQCHRKFRAPCCSESMARDSETLKTQSTVMKYRIRRKIQNCPKTQSTMMRQSRLRKIIDKVYHKRRPRFTSQHKDHTHCLQAW